MGNISKNLLDSGEKLDIFGNTLKIPSFSILIVVVFLVDLPKTHQNWIELVIRGPNLIECDKIGVKTT